MIKKLVLLLLLIVGLTSSSYADTSLKLPGDVDLGLVDMQAGMYYAFQTEKVYAGAEATILSWKNLLSLGGGVITPGEKGMPVAGLHANIGTLANKAGLDYKLPADIQLGFWAAKNLDFEENSVVAGHKWLTGLCLNVIKRF